MNLNNTKIVVTVRGYVWEFFKGARFKFIPGMNFRDEFLSQIVNDPWDEFCGCRVLIELF